MCGTRADVQLHWHHPRFGQSPRIADVSGKFQCSAATGQQFSDITPCLEGTMCRMQFGHFRTEVGWTTYGVTDITVLDEPIYSLGE